jgi:uncharacterized protein (TIGR03437 family)
MSQEVPAGGGNYSVNVTTACDWTVSTNDTAWITIGKGTGTGNGNQLYSVAPNPSGIPRAGFITINTQTLAIVQDGLTCTFNVAPLSSNFGPGGGKGQFNVQIAVQPAGLSACPWTVQNLPSWITASPVSSSGNGIVSYTVSAYELSQPQSATITVAGQQATITQSGVTCAFTLNPASAQVGYAAGTGTFAVAAIASDCPWSATTNTPWISITSGATGTGNGTVGYSIANSTSYLPRSGAIVVSGVPFAITQAPAPCAYSFFPASQSVPASGGNFPLGVTTQCAWTASTASNWIALNAGYTGITGDGTLSYTVAPNTTAPARTGTIQINDQSFSVNQLGNGCTYTVSPTSYSFPAAGGQVQVIIATGGACQWTVQNPAGWISVTEGGITVSSGTGVGVVSLTVVPNSAAARNATVTIAGQPIAISQSGIGAQFTAQSVVNGASYINGPLAPGELVTIFGSGLGPTTPAYLQTSPDGQFVTTSLGGTQVLFDGIAAPVTYASDGQVNAIVPFEVAGAVSTQVVLSAQGVPSNAVTLPVAASSPAIFADSGGAGQAAVLNQDNSPNGSSNPAAIGSVIQIFATGFGQTNPPGVDGQIAGPNISSPVAKVAATLGGIAAPAQYVGSSAGLVAGVIQVNVVVPTGVTPGDAVLLVLNVGGVSSAPGMTVAIQ